MSSPLAGAEMMTFLAPALRWALAFSASVKRPVDSMTMSTPRSFQGRAAGSFSARMAISRPSMMIDLSPGLDLAVVPAVRRVVLEQEGVHLGVDEVVDGDDLDIGVALGCDRLERLPADAAEPVDADPGRHGGELLALRAGVTLRARGWWLVVRRTRDGVRGAVRGPSIVRRQPRIGRMRWRSA